MVEIAWTEESLRWLEEIFEYIAFDNPAAAGQVVSGIYERVQSLAEYPEIGYRYLPSNRDVRILMYGHYRIAYLRKDAGSIDILGVFHGSLDISRYEL